MQPHAPLPATDAPQIEAHGTDLTATPPNHDVEKVIVAVHGVGDQHSFATLQSVVNQFCAYYQEPAAVPLGQFYRGKPPYPPYQLREPYPDQPFRALAFAEVYWAKIPRDLVGEQHTLEEAKQWARTIVERFRLRWRQRGKSADYEEADFVRIKAVLTEMIQTLAVLERLCYLAGRAGVFTFDLRKLLDDYLGDVQVVAEFENKRVEIIDAFKQTLRGVKTAYPKAEIYVVAHSEGTVVALLGLLEALGQPQPDDWIYQVHGLMTFGSPIDKHLILWPELFPDSRGVAWPAAHRIEWHNYYDRGGPIGFALNDTRAWLKEENLTRVFNFEDEHDYGFTRYPLPGKAHVDYWHDDQVFGHFIHRVVNQGQDQREPDYPDPPGDIRWKKWLSYFLPYVGVLAILYLAVFVLFKALSTYLDLKGSSHENDGFIFRHVANLTVLVLGVTVATRIPRITWSRKWRVGGVVVFGLLAAACLWLFPLESKSEHTLRNWLSNLTSLLLPAGSIRPLVATLIMLLTSWLSARRPTWGLVPLLLLGTAAILSFVVYQALQHPENEAPMWPIFPATAMFFYLWWLAALIFDLVFVWHVQIRQDQAMATIDKMVKSEARA